MNREVELEIAGQRIKIRTDEDEGYMQDLAAFVTQQLEELTGGPQKGTTTLSLVLLTALRIADDLYKLRQEHDGLNSSVEALAEQVESALARKTEAR